MSTHKAHTLNITYKQHYAQVVDKFGDTWTRTTNGNGNWVWVLGDYEENAPIYGATQTGTLPTALEPYRLELITWKRQGEILKAQLLANANEVNNISEEHKAAQEAFAEALAARANDPINPDYYKFPSGVEVADIAEHLTSNGGQIVQYVARSTRIDGSNKGEVIEDLEKASQLLNREIKRLKQIRRLGQNNG